MNDHLRIEDKGIPTADRNKKIGIFLIVTPFIGMVAIVASFAIANFVITQLGGSSGGADAASGAIIAGRIINVILGFLGIILVGWMFIGVPIGIFYLRKKVLADTAIYDKRSGKGDGSLIPDEVKGWNWGAFGLPVIWGLYHGVWISLLSFIPIFGIAFNIYLGLEGNELAWKKNKWVSTEQFRKFQGKWMIWGILGFIFAILMAISNIASIASDVATPNSSNETVSSYQAPVTNQSSQPSAPVVVKQPKPFSFTSSEDGFKAIFPNQPSREEESSDVGDIGTVKVTTYTSQKDGVNYYNFVYTYFDDRMNEANPNFSSVNVIEGAINGMANRDGASLISSKKTTTRGRVAYRYEIQFDDESMEGLIVYKDNRMYNIAVNYLTKNSAPSDTEKYIGSLELLD